MSTSEQVGNIILGHNVDVLREQIDADSIDLTVTSPPYDDLRTYGGFLIRFRVGNNVFNGRRNKAAAHRRRGLQSLL